MNRILQKRPTNKITTMTSAIIAIIFLFVSSTTLAVIQGQASNSPKVAIGSAVQNQSIAKLELKKILAKTNTFSAAFTQTILDEQAQLLQKAEGNIVLAKPNKMRWETSFPDETLLVADGDSVYNLDAAVEQLTIFSQSDVANNNPLMLLVSDDDSQWANVTVSKTSIKNQYAIVSNVQGATIQSVMVKFEDDTLIELVSVDAQNQSNVLVFSEVKSNPNIDADDFVVTAPDYFVVDDQRQRN